MNKYDTEYLDKEEKELDEALSRINPDSLKKPATEDLREMKKAAHEYVRAEKKMNIRVDSYELEKIKKAASREGLKYQTFVKSVVHKYLTGQLVDKGHEAG